MSHMQSDHPRYFPPHLIAWQVQDMGHCLVQHPDLATLQMNLPQCA